MCPKGPLRYVSLFPRSDGGYHALIIRVAEKLGDKAMEALRELSDIRTTYYHEELSDLAASAKKSNKVNTAKRERTAGRPAQK